MTITDPNILLQRLQKSLNILQQRQAKYGIDAPASLILEIDDHQTAITLTEQLAAGHLTETAWREQLKPLLVKIEEHQATEEVTNINIGGVNFSNISNSTIAVGDIDASVHIHSPPPQRDKNLTILLSNVRKIWVEDYLHRVLLNAIYLDLGLEMKQDAVPKPFEELNIRLRQPEQAEQKLPAGTRTIDVYRQAGGNLLILGQPGAGKTTMLATLAGDLVAEAQNEPAAPVPVIFNLSSWAAEQKPLEEWLTEELSRQYQVSRKLAERWLAEGDLALLLDGLDEVAVSRREACVAAINTYRELKATGPFVVCSRLVDYEVLQTRLKLGQTIVLEKLTQQQVEHYFQLLYKQTVKPTDPRSNEGLITLFQRIWQDKGLRELTETPLMLNIITMTYAYPNAPSLPTGQHEAVQAKIFKAYSERMFERVGRSKIKLLYPKTTSLRYLGYLAAQLQAHSLTQISIGQIRGSWLPVDFIRRLHKLLDGLIVGLFFGQFFGLFFGISVWLLGGLIFGLKAWLIFGLFFGLFFGLIIGLGGGPNDYEPVEVLRWKWRSALNGLIFGLVGGLIFGLVIWLLGGLIFGLIFGLIGGFIGGLIFGLSDEAINQKIEPDQELRRSLRSSLMVGLVFGLSVWLIGGLVGRLVGGLIFGLIFGLVGGLHYGGIFLFQHYLRLYQLNKRTLLPFKLIPFLDQATELIFLQRIGGSYRFIHRSVQEYFAAQWEEANGHMMEITNEQESTV
ncbi:MAG: NACHT domain-containing protein [Anaerolineae bacterium]|nr:NACHT domain-containing protein [Anaerolineae bacterium]